MRVGATIKERKLKRGPGKARPARLDSHDERKKAQQSRAAQHVQQHRERVHQKRNSTEASVQTKPRENEGHSLCGAATIEQVPEVRRGKMTELADWDPRTRKMRGRVKVGLKAGSWNSCHSHVSELVWNTNTNSPVRNRWSNTK